MPPHLLLSAQTSNQPAGMMDYGANEVNAVMEQLSAISLGCTFVSHNKVAIH